LLGLGVGVREKRRTVGEQRARPEQEAQLLRGALICWRRVEHVPLPVENQRSPEERLAAHEVAQALARQTACGE